MLFLCAMYQKRRSFCPVLLIRHYLKMINQEWHDSPSHCYVNKLTWPDLPHSTIFCKYLYYLFFNEIINRVNVPHTGCLRCLGLEMRRADSYRTRFCPAPSDNRRRPRVCGSWRSVYVQDRLYTYTVSRVTYADECRACIWTCVNLRSPKLLCVWRLGSWLGVF